MCSSDLSFRSADQVLALAGCDRLTISPNLLKELSTRSETLTGLRRRRTQPSGETLKEMSRNTFLLELAADLMANEKLADGITRFIQDQETLESLLSD